MVNLDHQDHKYAKDTISFIKCTNVADALH